MRSMLAVLCLAGCGPTTAFDGLWSGTWAEIDANGAAEGGSLSLKITDGQVSGGCTNTQLGGSCTVAGEISGSHAMVVYTYPNQGTADGDYSVSMLASHLTGNCSTSIGGTPTGTLTFDETLVEAPHACSTTGPCQP